MKVKKPKLDKKGYGHLGHFAKPKNIARGHNDSGSARDLLYTPNAVPPSTMPSSSMADMAQRRANADAVNKVKVDLDQPNQNKSFTGKMADQVDYEANLEKRAKARQAQKDSMKGSY